MVGARLGHGWAARRSLFNILRSSRCHFAAAWHKWSTLMHFADLQLKGASTGTQRLLQRIIKKISAARLKQIGLIRSESLSVAFYQLCFQMFRALHGMCRVCFLDQMHCIWSSGINPVNSRSYAMLCSFCSFIRNNRLVRLKRNNFSPCPWLTGQRWFALSFFWSIHIFSCGVLALCVATMEWQCHENHKTPSNVITWSNHLI